MDTFTKGNIRLGSTAATKKEALASIVTFAVERGYTSDTDGVLAGINEREEQMSTALMDGIAIPHTKHSSVDSAALLVQRFDQPIDWSGQQVSVTLTMLVPDAEAGTTHLSLLAEVSRALIDDEVRAVLTASDEHAIFQTLNSKLG